MCCMQMKSDLNGYCSENIHTPPPPPQKKAIGNSKGEWVGVFQRV